jgi:predicted metal-dependent HD superfamily phosphohydrolase
MFDLSTASFARAIKGAGGNPLAVPGEHARLLHGYAQPHRAYHTAQHIGECLELLSQTELPGAQMAEIALALWYHDAVYRPERQDNEARSARWFAFRARQFGLDFLTTERIGAMILATCHGAAKVPQDVQTQTLVDIDLAILGATASRFSEYCRQIRAEYLWVPMPLFTQKRAAVLAAFSAQSPIYHSAFGAQFEAPARQNLAAEMARLKDLG